MTTIMDIKEFLCVNTQGVVEFNNNSDGKYEVYMIKNGNGIGELMEWDEAVQLIDEIQKGKRFDFNGHGYRFVIKVKDSFGEKDYSVSVKHT